MLGIIHQAASTNISKKLGLCEYQKQESRQFAYLFMITFTIQYVSHFLLLFSSYVTNNNELFHIYFLVIITLQFSCFQFGKAFSQQAICTVEVKII